MDITPFSDFTERSVKPSPITHFFLYSNVLVFDDGILYSSLVHILRASPELSVMLQQGVCQFYGSVAHLVDHKSLILRDIIAP